jgi:Flp pilus assembly protein TadG
MKISRVRATALNGEHGIVLPFIALALVVICGMTALVVDIGQIALNRRRLQNATDAATMAAIRDLPKDVTGAKADAMLWATQNGLKTSEVVSVQVTSGEFTNDTITVTAQRTVPAAFATVLGISSKSVTTTAKAQVFKAVGADTTGAGIFPYAVWAGNKNGVNDITAGKSVTYRSNNYRGINVEATAPPCQDNDKKNCNWNVQANSFKGYFHWKNSYVYLDPTTKQVQDQGGNAIGTEPLDELIASQKAGTPVWLPMVTYADDSGTDLHFTIPNFACVLLDPIDTSGSADWTGVVQDPASAACKKSAGLITGPGTPSTVNPVYTTKLVD